MNVSSLASSTCTAGRNSGKVPHCATGINILVSLREECIPFCESSLACACLLQASDQCLSSLIGIPLDAKVANILCSV